MENIVAITNIKQIFFYISTYNIQPVWVAESENNPGKIVCYFIKSETTKPYRDWIARRPTKAQ